MPRAHLAVLATLNPRATHKHAPGQQPEEPGFRNLKMMQVAANVKPALSQQISLIAGFLCKRHTSPVSSTVATCGWHDNTKVIETSSEPKGVCIPTRRSMDFRSWFLPYNQHQLKRNYLTAHAGGSTEREFARTKLCLWSGLLGSLGQVISSLCTSVVLTVKWE